MAPPTEVAEPDVFETAPTDLEVPSLDVPAIEEVQPEATEQPAVAEPAEEEAVVEAAEEAGEAEPVEDETAAAEPADAEPADAESADEVAASGNGSGPLSDEDVERIAKRVVEMIGEKALREVAWEVIPDLAEVIIKERIRELESQVE
ncbi:MAG: hypothetical protein GY719_33090 [bacterium]|nr:hypothetical protein [bacterium]